MAQLDATTTTAGRPRAIAMAVEAAASESGLSRARLFDLIRTGELASVKVGRQRLIMRDDLERFLVAHRQHGAS